MLVQTNAKTVNKTNKTKITNGTANSNHSGAIHKTLQKFCTLIYKCLKRIRLSWRRQYVVGICRHFVVLNSRHPSATGLLPTFYDQSLQLQHHSKEDKWLVGKCNAVYWKTFHANMLTTYMTLNCTWTSCF